MSSNVLPGVHPSELDFEQLHKAEARAAFQRGRCRRNARTLPRWWSAPAASFVPGSRTFTTGDLLRTGYAIDLFADLKLPG